MGTTELVFETGSVVIVDELKVVVEEVVVGRVVGESVGLLLLLMVELPPKLWAKPSPTRAAKTTVAFILMTGF